MPVRLYTYANLFNDSEMAGGNLDGKITDVCGVKIAGLAGIFHSDIWYPPQDWNFESHHEYVKSVTEASYARDLIRKHTTTIFPEVYYNLLGSCDALVTHQAPCAHQYGLLAIDELGTSLGIKKGFHGHYHEDYESGIWTGVGRRGIRSMSGELILPGRIKRR
jgi:hypothetical protein